MKITRFFAVLIFTLSFCVATNAQQATPTLHAIIIADTDCDNENPDGNTYLSRSMKNDYESMIMAVKNIQAATGMTLSEYYMEDDFANKETMLETLKDLKCKENDVVIFYYTGHGARAVGDKSKFPQLTFDNIDSETYPLYRIDELIATKRPKFRLVMADCCNSVVAGLSVKTALTKGKSVVTKSASDIYRQLFNNAKGGVIVSSSQAGQTSGICEVNGVLRGTFTACFESEMEKLKSQNEQATWTLLLENAKTTTVKFTSSEGGKTQTPVFDIKIDGAAAGSPSTVPSSNNTAPSTAAVPVSQSNNLLISALIQLADNGATLRTRLDLVQPTLNQWFAPNAVVEVFGRSGNVRLTRETAEDFLNRVSTAYKLFNFAELDRKTSNSGKITYLKIHEIYKP